jgi:hypothetical protein
LQLPDRIRTADDEAVLAVIEQEVDSILHSRLVGSEGRDGQGETDVLVMIAAAQRVDNLIHHRRCQGGSYRLDCIADAFVAPQTDID